MKNIPRPTPPLAAAALAATLLAAAPTVAAAVGAPPGCEVRIEVRTEGGEPVPGARLTVLHGRESATTDARGEACVSAAADGVRRLVAVAPGFAVAESAVPAGAAAHRIVLDPAFGEELVVTATGTERRLADVPVHIQLIDRATIEATAARTLADAVEWTAGVRVESNCQNCNVSAVRMLGLEGPYSQLLIDGQPVVSSLAMVYGIEQLPARLVDSIEVVKGGGSAIYGAGAVGGVINLITHQPTDTHASIDLRRLAIGGVGGWSGSAVGDWTGDDGGRALTVYGQADRVEPVDVDGDAFTEVTRRELEAGGVRGDWYLLADAARLTVEASAHRESRRGGDLRRIDLAPHESALAEQIDTERLGAGLKWLHTVSPHLDYRLALSWADTDRTSYYGAGFDPDAYGATDNPLAVLDTQVNRYGARRTLTWGVQASRDEVEDLQLGYGRVISETYTDLGLFVQEDRKLGDALTLLYGVRVDEHSEVAEPIVSPRLALMWAPADTVTFRSSVARGFRPPSTFDEDLHIELVGGGTPLVIRNAEGLREETSTAALLSAEWRPTFGSKGSALLEASVFRTELDDLFDPQQADDPTTPELELVRVNFGAATVQGVELVAGLRWGSRLSGELAWIEQSSRFAHPEPDFASRDFLRTPERYGMANVQVRDVLGLDLLAGARYTGPMEVPHYAGFIAADRLETSPSFLELDLRVSRTFAFGGDRSVDLSVGVKNLTDEYQRDLDRGPERDASYVYGPRFPRTVTVGLSVEL